MRVRPESKCFSLHGSGLSLSSRRAIQNATVDVIGGTGWLPSRLLNRFSWESIKERWPETVRGLRSSADTGLFFSTSGTNLQAQNAPSTVVCSYGYMCLIVGLRYLSDALMTKRLPFLCACLLSLCVQQTCTPLLQKLLSSFRHPMPITSLLWTSMASRHGLWESR